MSDPDWAKRVCFAPSPSNSRHSNKEHIRPDPGSNLQKLNPAPLALLGPVLPNVPEPNKGDYVCGAATPGRPVALNYFELGPGLAKTTPAPLPSLSLSYVGTSSLLAPFAT